ncbi:hypothetical protein D3C80_1891190 [compost metagenome]
MLKAGKNLGRRQLFVSRNLISSVVQHVLQLLFIQLVTPFGHHYRRHAVTYQVGQGAGFGHKAVDTEDQGQTGQR